MNQVMIKEALQDQEWKYRDSCRKKFLFELNLQEDAIGIVCMFVCVFVCVCVCVCVCARAHACVLYVYISVVRHKIINYVGQINNLKLFHYNLLILIQIVFIKTVFSVIRDRSLIHCLCFNNDGILKKM